MLLTITTTHVPATDLGYLLGKHPDRFQTFPLPFGQAHVFFPEAREDSCTAALLLDIDQMGLVRGRPDRIAKGGPASSKGGLFGQYVTDRAYAASSLMSVALARVFSSALKGTCRDRPELAESALPLSAEVAVLPCRDGEGLLQRLFEPLGYNVTLRPLPLDERFPEWGEGRHYQVSLSGTLRLCELLSHLYVLIPVIDDEKHYWVGQDELGKLIEHARGWLEKHPEQELITLRYLKHQRLLSRQALASLTPEKESEIHFGDDPERNMDRPISGKAEDALEQRISLNEHRIDAVVGVLKKLGARRIVDLGCGEGRLLRALLMEREFERITGMDVSLSALDRARRRLRLDEGSAGQSERINLFQGSLIYRDKRLEGFDAACILEVIEHLDPDRLAAFERSIFGLARPKAVIVTTPNADHNALFPSLSPGQFRHHDHRFEWSRAEFANWTQEVARRYGYTVGLAGIGHEDVHLGPPTQMGVFTLCA
ncbi:3' terminal RNA ribose 2'-O-methyltransferase Hen1 [Desulfonatronovibrio magnus]|uniref:3' terminal RNA ribose 2'-O-methyltransferase Hen1 n=1 Tax=Desulfonatronovibrio magnus TaxID=698827 RepID=UPI0005EADBB4|nr:3' terminal RNA ribose 2'-O-methyltransferase Hen1 [Desulfonatronovibrio magnus]